MDEKLRKYYENRMNMCSSDAWRDLLEDIEAMLVSTNSLDGVNNEATLNFKKGEISIMRWIISLKEISERAYSELKDQI